MYLLSGELCLRVDSNVYELFTHVQKRGALLERKEKTSEPF